MSSGNPRTALLGCKSVSLSASAKKEALAGPFERFSNRLRASANERTTTSLNYGMDNLNYDHDTLKICRVRSSESVEKDVRAAQFERSTSLARDRLTHWRDECCAKAAEMQRSRRQQEASGFAFPPGRPQRQPRRVHHPVPNRPRHDRHVSAALSGGRQSLSTGVRDQEAHRRRLRPHGCGFGAGDRPAKDVGGERSSMWVRIEAAVMTRLATGMNTRPTSRRGRRSVRVAPTVARSIAFRTSFSVGGSIRM